MTAKLLFSRSNVLKHYHISQQLADDWHCSSGRRGIRLYRTRELHERAEDGFSKACLSGLHNTVAYMMEDPKFNVPAKDKEAYLMGAILNKHPEVAEVLLKYGVSPDASDFDGRAVYKASNWGLTQVVRELIKAGADLSGDTSDGRGDFTSALCAAAENGYLEIVEDLLKAGHHVRIQDSLQRAVGNGHHAIVELLVDWGACEAEPIHDHVLEMAAFRGTIQLVCRLLDARSDGYDKNKLKNALSRACEAGRIDIVRLLVSRGAQADRSINFQYKNSMYDDRKIHWGKKILFKRGCRIRERKAQNCLVLAAQSGNKDIVKMLLDKEFDLSQVLDLKKELEVTTSIYAGEAFVMALLGCHSSVILTLLDAMVNHACTDEIATLRAASEYQNRHILRRLSESIEPDMSTMRKFPGFSWLVKRLHELLLGHQKNIFQTLLKEAGSRYFIRRRSKDLLLPLEVAASVGSVVTIEKFIQAGVDLSIGEPLFYAIVNGHEEVVRLLLDQGVDVNSIMTEHDGPQAGSLLFQACSSKLSVVSDSIAHMLLDHGADYDYVAPSSGDTALHSAAKNGRVSVVERLLNFGGVHKMNDSGHTALHVASNADVIRVLLLAGANKNARADDCWTPLHNAATQDSPDGIEVLLHYGANVHAPTQDGRTALHAALEFRRAFDWNGLRIVQLLLEKGADVNAVDDEGMTPFHTATRTTLSQATVDIIALLINQGASVDSQDNYGSTALHQVAGSVDWANLLLDHGVAIDTRDGGGRTALFYSFEGSTVPYWPSDLDSPFPLPFDHGYLDVARFLIERGADIKIVTNSGETLLHAMNANTLSLCTILLERGVQVNALTIDGCSPIAYVLDKISAIREKNREGGNDLYLPRLEPPKIPQLEQIIRLLAENGGKNIRNWQEEDYSLGEEIE